MSKKKLLRGFVFGAVAVVYLTTAPDKMLYADTILGSEDVNVEKVSGTVEKGENRSAQLVWMTKEVNGKTYRRLYDATNEVWLTDWILCE